jgi:hypothetical protein
MLHGGTLINIIWFFVVENVICSLIVVNLKGRSAIFKQLMPFYISLIYLKLGYLCLKHAFSFKSMNFLESAHKSEKLSLILVDVNISTNFLKQWISVKQIISSTCSLNFSRASRIMNADKRQPQVSS